MAANLFGRTAAWIGGAAIIMAVITATASAGEIEVNGVPLPDDADVRQESSVSPRLLRFLGAWIGRWEGKGQTRKHILIVEKITRDGKAEAIVAWEGNPAAGLSRGWKRLRGKVTGTTISLDDDETSYRFVTTGRLAGLNREDGSKATMRRFPMAMWLKNGAHRATEDKTAAIGTIDVRLIQKIANGTSCDLVVTFHNGLDFKVERAELEIFALNTAGMAQSGFWLAAKPLASGQTRQLRFALPLACDTLGAIAVNGFSTCKSETNQRDTCNRALVASSETDLPFSDAAN